MKKIFLNLIALSLLGLGLTACNNDEANKKAMEADQSSVDAMIADKMKSIDAEVSAACDAKVMEQAHLVLDSLSKTKAATPEMKKVIAAVKAKHPHHATPAKPAAPAPAPAKPADTKPTNTNRPGTNETAPPASNNARPGTNQSTAPASNTKRPGAN